MRPDHLVRLMRMQDPFRAAFGFVMARERVDTDKTLSGCFKPH
jgi:hypothetical protein